jgi:hypothetical protein
MFRKLSKKLDAKNMSSEKSIFSKRIKQHTRKIKILNRLSRPWKNRD